MEPRDGAADDHHLGGSQLPAEAHEAAGQEDEEGAAAQSTIPGRHKQQGSSSSPTPPLKPLAHGVPPLPAVPLHQHPHQQGAHQPTQGEDGDSQGIEEGQGGRAQPVSEPLGPRGVVENLYVLQGRDTQAPDCWQKGEDKGRRDL